MSADDKIPKDGVPTIDSLLKGNNWEARVAEARVKREKVLAAKSRVPEVQTVSKVQTGPQTEAAPMIKIKVKPKPEAAPLRAIRSEQNSPAPPRLRLRWVFLGIGIAACAAGAFMFWIR